MKLIKDSHWVSLFDPDPDKYFGFIYFIKNLVTDKKYIGKKQYWLKRSDRARKSTCTEPTSDRWRRDHWRESDWKSYISSSASLKKDIKKYGKENFFFLMLHQWENKSRLHYAEIKEQVKRDVLMAQEYGEYVYYNRQIAAIKFRPPEFHTDKTKDKLKQILKERGHPMEGREHPSRGKKMPQCAAKNCVPAQSIHITDGKENRWWPKDKEEYIPLGWRKGITRKDKGRGRRLSKKEVEVRKKASLIAKEKRQEKMAIKAGFSSYQEFITALIIDYEDGSKRADLSKKYHIGWTTADRIIKAQKNGV